MALTNFILTVAGVSAVVLLLRSDVKQSATVFRRNVKHIRKWLEEESANAPKVQKSCPAKLGHGLLPKIPPKYDLEDSMNCDMKFHWNFAFRITKELESKVSPKEIPKEDKH
ncbi:unnamed protein product [Prunus armeniaca]|uniref:Uncharacterized protein n=2 Tax=Prunus armeniaca TaxID=36596 RepID=A0A6J5WFJ0_PRUAR|nr:unnamed protein product [Prunus armeniaca]